MVTDQAQPPDQHASHQRRSCNVLQRFDTSMTSRLYPFCNIVTKAPDTAICTKQDRQLSRTAGRASSASITRPCRKGVRDELEAFLCEQQHLGRPKRQSSAGRVRTYDWTDYRIFKSRWRTLGASVLIPHPIPNSRARVRRGACGLARRPECDLPARGADDRLEARGRRSVRSATGGFQTFVLLLRGTTLVLAPEQRAEIARVAAIARLPRALGLSIRCF